MSKLAVEEGCLLRHIVVDGPIRLVGRERAVARVLERHGLVRAVVSCRAGSAPYYVASGAGYDAVAWSPGKGATETRRDMPAPA